MRSRAVHYAGIVALVMASAVASAIPCSAQAAGASGYFRIGATRLDVHHAIAVIEDTSIDGDGNNTMVLLSAVPLDAAQAAAAFDPLDAVRNQEPAGGYLRLCITAEGSDCGLFFSPEGFNTGGYGELTFERRDAQHVTGRFALAKPQDFMGQAYEFDLRFDTPIAAAPGVPLPDGGGEPGHAYNRYLEALAKADFAALRAMAGESGRWQYPEDDPIAAKEALKSARDGQPLQAEIVRGRLHGEEAVLWVRGVDRDDIPRAGRVRMLRDAQGWRFDASDLESAGE